MFKYVPFRVQVYVTILYSVCIYLFISLFWVLVLFCNVLPDFLYSEYRLYVYMWFEPEHNPSLRLTFRLFPGLSQFQYNFLHSSFS